ncbi:MAG: glycosyltransferase [Chloroflexota bacterium]
MRTTAYNLAMIAVHSCPLGKVGSHDTGGMNVYLRETALQLAERKCRVDIFTRTHDSDHDCIVNLGDGVRIIHVEEGIDQALPKEALYAYFERYTCSIEEFRKSEGGAYDLVHSHYWVSGPVGQELKTGWRVPHVVTFHTLGAVKNLVGAGEPETDLRIVSEKEVANHCDRIIAPTEREREALCEHYEVPGDRIGVVPCGVNLELFRPHNRTSARQTLGLNGDRVILCVARIDPVKGLDQLIEALGMVDCHHAPQLIVVGGDEHSDAAVAYLKDKARAAGVARCVNFVGRVAHEILPLYYSAADICIVPSRYESFGLVILEALACGTPVVATDVGIARSVLKHPGLGWIVPENSPLSLARTITYTLKYSDQSDEVKLARRAAVNRYAWPEVTGTLFQEYRTLLS